MGGIRLSPLIVFEIKRLAFIHYDQSDISRMTCVSQGHISRIVCGKVFTSVPFPDGSRGALSPARRRLSREYRLRYMGAMEKYRDSYELPQGREYYTKGQILEGYFD